MDRRWFAFISILQVLTPSMQVLMSPCKVENVEISPNYATSLTTKALVQVVQIPPVFVQNVEVGRCVNASPPEVIHESKENFICKQRYSAVELYTMRPTVVPVIYNNGTAPGLIENFKMGRFTKEWVMVESGCNFTYILLPVVNNYAATQTNPGPFVHLHHYLRSPFYPDLTRTHYPSALPSTGSNYQVTSPTKPLPPPETTYHNAPLYQEAVTNTTYVAPSPGPGYAQGGNAEHDYPAPTNHTLSTSDYAKPHESVHKGNAHPSPYELQKGSAGTIQERAKGHEEPHPPKHDPTSHHQHHVPDTPHLHPPPNPTIKDPIPYDQLYGISNKIGLPLYILDPEIDPLLKNIEGKNPMLHHY